MLLGPKPQKALLRALRVLRGANALPESELPVRDRTTKTRRFTAAEQTLFGPKPQKALLRVFVFFVVQTPFPHNADAA